MDIPTNRADRQYEVQNLPEPKTFSLQELREIDSKLSCYYWDERLGEKPKGWDKAPEQSRGFWIFRRKDRYDLMESLVNEIGYYVYGVRCSTPPRARRNLIYGLQGIGLTAVAVYAAWAVWVAFLR